MRKVLVAGGSSFIGSSLIKYLNSTYPGFNVVNFDRHDGRALRGLPVGEPDSQYYFVRGDLTNREQTWHHTILTELIVNCVWSDAGAVPMHSNEYVETTLVGLNNLLQSARVRGTSRLIQISSADVYGPRSSGQSRETDRLKPKTLAAGIRGAADVLVESFAQQWDLGAIIIRATNVYGPHMSPHELLPSTIKAVIEGKVIPEDLDPSTFRDWIHIDDLCRAIDVILHRGLVKEIYNVGSGEVITDSTLVRMISEAAGKKLGSRWTEPKRSSGVAVSTAKVEKLGWKAERSLEESLPGLIEAYSKGAKAKA